MFITYKNTSSECEPPNFAMLFAIYRHCRLKHVVPRCPLQLDRLAAVLSDYCFISIHFHFRESEATGGPADQVQGLHQDQQAEDLGPRRDEPESLGADDRAGGGVRGA